MKLAPIPPNEKDRICAVEGLKILDTASEERFDRITKAALQRFLVPISTIAIIDSEREWFKSVQGLKLKEGPRDISFCGHALLSELILVVNDTLLDPRFSDNPMVVGAPFIRFYAGKSLYDFETKLPVGVFCIKDHTPREMSLKDISDFLDLSDQAEREINIKIGR
jgi:GAF domain-containing protein